MKLAGEKASIALTACFEMNTLQAMDLPWKGFATRAAQRAPDPIPANSIGA
jgi:hypothetical protein